MEQLRKLLDVGRDHFEKLILILALLGLGAAVWLLNGVRQEEAAKIDAYLEDISSSTNKPFEPADMAPHRAAFKAAQEPLAADFGLPHNLFNPVKWQRQPNGDLIKIETGGEVGPAVMEYTKATPLHFIISFERATGSGYYLGVTREAAEHPLFRRKRPSYATVGTTNEFYTLLEVKGEQRNPDELILQLMDDSKDVVSLAPDKPFKRIEGYEADLNYPPEGLKFPNQRVGAVLRFAGEDYKIVAIDANQVVLSASSNNKKYTVTR